MKKLFLDDMPREKVAGTQTMLSDDSDQWNFQVLDVAHKNVPYLSNYKTEVMLDRVDPLSGSGFGALLVTPKENPEAGIGPSKKRVLLPLIVRERILSPLDLMIVGDRVFPLSEEKLSRALFRPETFELSRRKLAPDSPVASLYGPENQYYEYVKAAAMPDKLLHAIIPTLLETDKTALVERISDDQFLVQEATRPGAFGTGVESVVKAPKMFQKEASLQAVRDSLVPDVFQVIKVAQGNYVVRTATANPFSILSNSMDTGRFTKLASDALVNQVENEGQATIVSNPVTQEGLSGEVVEPVQDFGEWRVKTDTGESLVGWVIPNLIDFSMNNTGLCLFSNGSSYSLQEEVAGSRVDQGTNLPDDAPEGFGTFYCVRDGRVLATLPVNIAGQDVVENLVGWYGTDTLGEPFKVAKQRGTFKEGLRGIAEMDDHVYLIPDDFKFMKINGNQVNLMTKPEAIESEAKVAMAYPNVDIGYNGSYFLRGDALTKIASHCKDLDRNDALLLLGMVGVSVEDANKALNKAASGYLTVVQGNRTAGLMEDFVDEPLRKAASMTENALSIRANLTKEAAIIALGLEKIGESTAAENSVDKLLSLGLINPENMAIFGSYIPAIEDTQSKLAELLLASRAGNLSEIPESSLEKALQYTESSLNGIRKATERISY